MNPALHTSGEDPCRPILNQCVYWTTQHPGSYPGGGGGGFPVFVTPPEYPENDLFFQNL